MISRYPYLIFDNFIHDEDLDNAYEELNRLDPNITGTPETQGSAVDGHGNLKKKNLSLWIKDYYNDSNESYLILNMQKLFHPKLVDDIVSFDNIFAYMSQQSMFKDRYPILLSKYQDGDYYDFHKDASIYTAILFLSIESKDFVGGDFVLSHNDGTQEVIEFKNNRLILFPSICSHSVTPIKGSGVRFSVSMFIAEWWLNNES